MYRLNKTSESPRPTKSSCGGHIQVARGVILGETRGSDPPIVEGEGGPHFWRQKVNFFAFSSS